MENYKMEYNTEREQIVIPENGRHVQSIVRSLLEIEDKEKRTAQAYEAIRMLQNLNPNYRNIEEIKNMLWDQLFIMSNFELDVDAPFPKPSPEMIAEKPERMEYPKVSNKFRYYGNILKGMIKSIKDLEEGDFKKGISWAVANHMKKCNARWNKDNIEDAVIFEHLYELSDGKIDYRNTTEELISNESINAGRKDRNQKYHKKSNNNYKKRTNRK